MKRIHYIITILLLTLSCQPMFGQGTITRSKSTKTTSASKQNTIIRISDPDGYISGYGYVDLGLPSGLKWATCNIGASSYKEYGHYFAWGETNPKEVYLGENSRTQGKNIIQLKSEGIIDSSGILQPNSDAAQSNWSDSWRTPTKLEMEELINNCRWEWVSSFKGFKVIGPNGKSIYFPAAGYRAFSSLCHSGEIGLLWSSLVCEGSTRACLLNVKYNSYLGKPEVLFDNENRRIGHPIRAVSD